MQSETVQWDLRSMTDGSSGLAEVFSVYLVVFFLACSWKIVRVWRIVLQRLQGDPNQHIRELTKVGKSTTKWFQLTFLAWGIYISLLTANTSTTWVIDSSHYLRIWPPVLREIAQVTGGMLFMVAFLFLGGWYIDKRIGELSRG